MDSIENFLELGTQFFNMYSRMMKSQYNSWYQAVNDCDKATQDILHNFELANLDRNQKNKNATELREIRQDRRYYKDKVECLNKVKSVIDSNTNVNFDKLFNQFANAFGNARLGYESRYNRKYKPKYIKDIELIEQQTDKDSLKSGEI